MRRAAKRDANEDPIRDALAAYGVTVKPLSDPGWPDLGCYDHQSGQLYLAEIKASKGKLTRLQRAFPLPYVVLRSADEAIRDLNQRRRGSA